MKSEAKYKERKMIVVDSCTNCPHGGNCVAWKSLTKIQRVTLSIDNSIPDHFILKGCPLPYGEDNAEPTPLQV